MRHLLAASLLGLTLAQPFASWAGAQEQEILSPQTRSLMQKAISSGLRHNSLKYAFGNEAQANAWITEMSARLKKNMPDEFERVYFLKTLHYAASRAGLDPQLVLGLIQVESGFKKYAISSVGARGYMQVMPFWTKQIGNSNDDLLDMRTNLLYGCIILRHYLDIEKGNLFRALGRYNGSLGKPHYPNLVLGAWKSRWQYS